MAESYIFTGGSEKNAAVVYDRGTLKVTELMRFSSVCSSDLFVEAHIVFSIFDS